MQSTVRRDRAPPKTRGPFGAPVILAASRLRGTTDRVRAAPKRAARLSPPPRPASDHAPPRPRLPAQYKFSLEPMLVNAPGRAQNW